MCLHFKSKNKNARLTQGHCRNAAYSEKVSTHISTCSADTLSISQTSTRFSIRRNICGACAGDVSCSDHPPPPLSPPHHHHRQVKMFLHGPDKQLSRFALRLHRKQLRSLAGLLTGHITLNRRLTVMKIRTNPLCPACGEQEETSYHYLGKCCAIMLVRYSIMGAYLMEPGELSKLTLATLLRFARASKRFL